jgi:putative RecB family exonuclease
MTYTRNPITEEKQLEILRISPSSINTFNQCPRKWYYEYIEARETEPTVHLIRGNVVHKTLEDIFKVRYFPSGEAFRTAMMDKAIAYFEYYWENDFKDFEISKELEKQYYDESKFMIERFINKFCDNIQDGIKSKKYSNESQGYYFTKPTFKELWIDDEKKIKFSDKWKREFVKKEDLEDIEDTLHVGGFIDSVQKDFDQNIILVDYKTSSKYLNVLSDDYVTQLGIYAYLWFKQTGKLPKYVAVNYLKYDESYYILVTPSLVAMAIRKIKDMRNAIIEYGLNKENYFIKESKLCDWCNHKEECLGIQDEKD